MALLSGSTAIDAIPYGSCTDANGNSVLTDQRGIARAGNCDIGAYEVQAIANVCPSGQTTPAPCSTTIKLTLVVSGDLEGVTPHVVTQGTTGLDFSLTDFSCSGNTCTVLLKFAPIAPGLREGGVYITNINSAFLASADVYGIGESPAVAFVGGAETTFASLSSAGYLAVDAAGDVFVTNNSLPGVTEIPAGCSSSACYQTLASWLGFTTEGVAVDGAGNLYVSVPQNVYKIPVGCTSNLCQVTVGGGFGAPEGLAVDGAGSVYVADIYNGAPLWEVPVAGPQFTVGTGLNSPEDAVVDSANNVFVGDPSLRYLVEIPPGGGSQTNIGSFSCPDAVAVDAAGDLFATDGCGGATEFPAGCTSNSCVIPVANDLNGPVDVKLDSLGNIFITDQGNSRVQEVHRSQPPTLVFGSVTEGTGSPAQTVTIQNIGNQPLAFSGIGITLDSADFKAVSAANACSTSSPLAPGATCNVGIECAPVHSGSLTGTLTLVDNTLNAVSGAQQVPLTCSGVTPAIATATSLSSSLNPSFASPPNNSVTFTATVTAIGNPVTSGTVSFTDGANTISGCGAVAVSSGQATCTTAFATQGDHQITGSYNGVPNLYATSSGMIDQEVDNHTVVTGNHYCNQGAISVPVALGEATPYPSRIFVSGYSGNTNTITVQLNNISSGDLPLMDLLLVGPTGATLVPFARIGNNTSISGINVSLDDSAAVALANSSTQTSGTFKPSAFDISDLSFPAPAPATITYAQPHGTSTLTSQFGNTSPNGTWELFAMGSADNGPTTIGGGWCITLPAAPVTPNVSGVSTTYGSTAGVPASATFTGSGGIAPSGTVTFSSATGSFTTASCTSSGATLSCSSTYTPSGTLAANTYATYITASITAAGGYAAGSGTGTLTVSQQTPTVAVTNVSVSSETYGSATPTTVTATLSWTGSGVAPTGGLSFNSTAAGSFGSTNCSGTTSPISCSATFTPTATDITGSYTLSANFVGDTNYASAGSAQTNNFSIVQQTPTVAVTNVSVASEAYGTGTSTTVTATLSWTGNGTAPIGGLSFSSTAAGSFGSANCSGTTSPISCSATFTPTATDITGSYTLSGKFLGDSHYGDAPAAPRRTTSASSSRRPPSP